MASPSPSPTSSSSSSPLLHALELLSTHGVLYIHSCPVSPSSTHSLCRSLISGRQVRETHYGHFWDFTADFKHGDLAYSNLALGAHTDGSYFSDPAGLQLFHLLAHPPPGEGGESLLVDGFLAAETLKTEDERAYETLSRLKTSAVAAGTEGFLYHTTEGHSVFEHDQKGRLVRVRWNNEDRSKLGGRGWTGEEVDEWYRAARRWEEILRRRESQVWVKLKPGTTVGQCLSFFSSSWPIFLRGI